MFGIQITIIKNNWLCFRFAIRLWHKGWEHIWLSVVNFSAKSLKLLEIRFQAPATDAMETDCDTEKSENLGSEYIVEAIVKKKLLFKARPKPIIVVKK